MALTEFRTEMTGKLELSEGLWSVGASDRRKLQVSTIDTHFPDSLTYARARKMTTKAKLTADGPEEQPADDDRDARACTRDTRRMLHGRQSNLPRA